MKKSIRLIFAAVLFASFLISAIPAFAEFTYTYYTDTGNTQTIYDEYSRMLYTFEDSNYFNVDGAHGHGRLLRIEWENGEYDEYTYFGLTLKIKEDKSRRIEGGGIVRDKVDTNRDEDMYDIRCVANDASGNTYMTATVNNNGRIDAYVAKYDSNGAKVAGAYFLTNTWLHNTAVEVDSQGNVIVATRMWNGTNEDIYVAKYDSNLTQKLWDYTYDSGGHERLNDVAVDSAGNIILTGTKGDWPSQDMIVVKLDSALPNTNPPVWVRTYDNGDNDAQGHAIEIGENDSIMVHGSLAILDVDYSQYSFLYDANGNLLSQYYDLTEPSYYNDFSGESVTGRQFSEDTLYSDGAIDFHLELGYVAGTDLSILDYAYIYPDMDEPAIFFGYYGMSGDYPDTGFRAIFDSGKIAEFKIEGNGDIEDASKPTKLITTDGTTAWFLWDVDYAGEAHQYVIIENTIQNEWYAYTFNPATLPFQLLNKSNWTPISPADPAGLTLPELGPWPQEGVTVEFPPAPALYYDSGRVQYQYTDWSIESYLDESFYGSLPGQGRVAWRYRTSGTSHAPYTLYKEYFPGTDRRARAYYYGNDPEEANAFDYMLESYYNESFYNVDNDGLGRLYQMVMIDGLDTYQIYYKGTDKVAGGRLNVRSGTYGYMTGPYRTYYNADFTVAKTRITLEEGSRAPDGAPNTGTIVEWLEEEHDWILKKTISPSDDRAWFIYPAIYRNTPNVILERTSAGIWRAYTFAYGLSQAELVARSNWTPISDPTETDDILRTLVENYWPPLVPENWGQLNEKEFPPLYTDYIRDAQDRVIKKVDHSDLLDVIYVYEWIPEWYGGISRVTVSLDTDKDGTADVPASTTIYSNLTDYDISHIQDWQVRSFVTFYDSGNIKEFLTDWGKHLTYMDENYYQSPTGQGRLIQMVEPAGRTTKIEYHDDSARNVKSLNIDGKATSYYNEYYFTNTRIAIDLAGNTIEIAQLANPIHHNYDCYVVKKDPAGNKIWSRVYGEEFYYEAMAVAVDSHDNIIVTGGGGGNWTTLKYAPDGALVNGFPIVLHTGDSPLAIAIDSHDNIIVTGSSKNGDQRDFLTVKYDSSGNLLWQDSRDLGIEDAAREVYIDEGDNITVIGSYSNLNNDWFRYAINYDSNGNVISEGNILENRSYNMDWELGGITGRIYIDVWEFGATSTNYAYYRYAKLMRHQDDLGPGMGGATFYMYLDPAPYSGPKIYGKEGIRVKGDRIEFDGSDTRVAEDLWVDETDSSAGTMLTKVEMRNGDTFWLLWGDHEVNGELYTNVVIQRTATGAWNAFYNFTPDIQNPSNVMDSSVWIWIGTLSNPELIDLPELGSWEEYNARNNIMPEFPPLSTGYTYDGQGRVTERLDHNDYTDVRIVYQWGAGTVTELVYHEKDGASRLVSKTLYANGADYDLSHKSSWQIRNQFTYYDSGNLLSYYEGDTRQLYVFRDEDYYNYPNTHPGSGGRGRLMRYERTNADGSMDFREFEYYGDTLDVRKVTQPSWENGQILAGSLYEEVKYNEEFYKNPHVAVDSNGNKIVSTVVIGDDSGVNVYLAKYDSAGNYLWSTEAVTGTLALNTAVAVDGSDNIYLAVTGWGGVNLNDVFVYKFTPGGGVPIAAYLYMNADTHDFISYMVIDPSGNVYISGQEDHYPADGNLFVVKLDSALNELWRMTYDSGGWDMGGYLTLDGQNNPVIHVNRHDTGGICPEYDKVTIDPSNGAILSVVYDELEMSYDPYFGAFESGRTYKETETMNGALFNDRILYAYISGTNKRLIEYNSAMSDIHGGAITYYFYNSSLTERAATRVEFDSGAIGESIRLQSGGFQITKFIENSATYWFLHGEDVYQGHDNVVIERTSQGAWNAYTFIPAPDPDHPDTVLSRADWTLIGPVSDPESLTLPELGSWWGWCINNDIAPEFPALSSDYTYDGQGRALTRSDHNDYMDTLYMYTWDAPAAGQMRVAMSYDYNGDGTNELILSRIYQNGSDYDISHINSWRLVSETYGLSGRVYDYDAVGHRVERIDPNGAVYTYYASGRIRSKTIPGKSPYGPITYEYIDEDWNAREYGRVSKIIGPDGKYRVYTEYFPGTDKVKFMSEYVLDGRELFKYQFNSAGQVSMRWFKNRVEQFTWEAVTYTYYRMGWLYVKIKSKALPAPDENGMIYYEFNDESFDINGDGIKEDYGRIKYMKRDAPVNGEWVYRVYYYYEPNPRYIRISQKLAYSDAAGTVFVAEYRYYNDRENRLWSKRLKTPEASGNQFYLYKNESFDHDGDGVIEEDENYSRVERLWRVAENRTEYCFIYSYYGNTNRIYQRSSYQWTLINMYQTPGPTSRVATYTHYDDAFNRVKSKALRNYDAARNVYYRYMNEPFYDIGTVNEHGRPEALQTASQALGYREWRFASYWGNTDKMREKEEWKDLDKDGIYDQKLSKFEYDENGGLIAENQHYTDQSNRLKSRSLPRPDASGNKLYYYRNESFDHDGDGIIEDDENYGRIEVTAPAVTNGVENYFAYAYYGDTNHIRERDSYRYISYRPWENEAPVLTSRVAAYIHYDDADNRAQSKTLVTPDASGNFYYQYKNEPFYNVGTIGEHGRLDILRLYDRQAGENREWRFVSYWGETDVVHEKEEWRDYDCDGIFDTRLRGIEYDSDGRMIRETRDDGSVYTFYESGRVRSMLVPGTSPYDNITYEYYDEDWLQAPQGRTSRITGPDGKYRIFEYFTGTDKVNFISEYTTGGVETVRTELNLNGQVVARTIKNRVAIFTQNGVTYRYNQYGSRSLYSKTLSAPDASGMVYYEFMAENFDFDGNGIAENYGRVSKAVRSAPVDGEYGYRYSYYWASSKVFLKYAYPSLGNYTVLYRYYSDYMNRMAEKRLVSADNLGNIYYHYKKESFDHDGDGTVEANENYGRINATVSVIDGNRYITTYDYYGSTSRVSIRDIFSYYASFIPYPSVSVRDDCPVNAQYRIETRNYYNDASNRLWQKTLRSPDASGNSYYQYKNEPFYNIGTPDEEGRLDVSRGYDSQAGENREWHFVSYWNDTDKVREKEEWRDSDGNGSFDQKVRTLEYDPDGNLITGQRTAAPNYTFTSQMTTPNNNTFPGEIR